MIWGWKVKQCFDRNDTKKAIVYWNQIEYLLIVNTTFISAFASGNYFRLLRRTYCQFQKKFWIELISGSFTVDNFWLNNLTLDFVRISATLQSRASLFSDRALIWLDWMKATKGKYTWTAGSWAEEWTITCRGADPWMAVAPWAVSC